MYKLVISTLYLLVISIFTIADTHRDYQLLWEDQFEGNAINAQYWNIEQGGSSAWNNTAIDDPRVIEVSEGTLKLKAIKNPNYTSSLSNVGTIDKNSIWTGAIDTRLKVDFKYGKVEIRARMESVPRAWPAIWLMPTHSVYGGNPNSGEIDMVERLNRDSYFYSTIHTEYHWSASNGKSDPERYATPAATDLDQWATYEMEWDENKIDFFRNGNKYHTFNKGESAIVGGYRRWPFDEDFYIILSQQIGGGWVDGEASSQGLVLQDSDLPYEMEIDYVKVYQRDIVSTLDNSKSKKLSFKGNVFSAYRTNTGNIRLSKSSSWIVYDLSGKIIKKGRGNLIPFANQTSGCYLIETKFGATKVAIP